MSRLAQVCLAQIMVSAMILTELVLHGAGDDRVNHPSVHRLNILHTEGVKPLKATSTVEGLKVSLYGSLLITLFHFF